MSKRGFCLILMAAAVGVSLTACGYSTSALLRKDIRTISVPVFDNQTFYRGLEVQLTKSMVEELKLHTRLRFAARADADSVLEGDLISYSESVRSKTSNDDILLKQVTATARFRWVDNLTGREIVPWKTVRESTLYAVAVGESQGASVFRELAQRIVEKMEKEW